MQSFIHISIVDEWAVEGRSGAPGSRGLTLGRRLAILRPGRQPTSGAGCPILAVFFCGKCGNPPTSAFRRCAFTCGPGWFWIPAGFFEGFPGGDLVHLLANAGLIDAKLDGKIDDVAGAPVERQPRGVMPQHESEHDRHQDGQHAPLRRILARRGRDVLREEHADDDDDGQNVQSDRAKTRSVSQNQWAWRSSTAFCSTRK